MCLSTPSVPKTGPPPQAAKEPDTLAERKKRQTATQKAGGGSILTGPSGVSNQSLNTGGSTILGG